MNCKNRSVPHKTCDLVSLFIYFLSEIRGSKNSQHGRDSANCVDCYLAGDFNGGRRIETAGAAFEGAKTEQVTRTQQ